MMSRKAKQELVNAVRPRYMTAAPEAKTQILDELVANTGYHRKYAIQLLNKPPERKIVRPRVVRRKYVGSMVVALEQIWRAAEFICGKRLAAAIPLYLEAMEAHNELRVDRDARELLLQVGPATIDRLLKRARQHERPHGLSTTKPGTLLKHAIPIRTFAQWDGARPGFVEVDLVAHCGETTRGEHLYTLNMVDIKTRWVEFVPLINRSQAAVTVGIDQCRLRLPFPLLGLDSDNGSEFINQDLTRYCGEHHITFTRCRPYHKNDQCYVEHKNWTEVRQAVGYDRFEGIEAYRALEFLYQPLRLYRNFFQPVMVLLSKVRDGARVKRMYDEAKTPYQRVLDAPEVPDTHKQALRDLYPSLNPAALQREFHRRQELLWALASRPAPREDLSTFLQALAGSGSAGHSCAR